MRIFHLNEIYYLIISETSNKLFSEGNLSQRWKFIIKLVDVPDVSCDFKKINFKIKLLKNQFL